MQVGLLIGCYAGYLMLLTFHFGEQAGLSTLVVVKMYTILLLLCTGFLLHMYLNFVLLQLDCELTLRS